MDISGFNWTLITIVGVIALGVIIAVAKLRNRTPPAKAEDSEEATRRVYEQEEREHRGESDHVP
jgi:hypothetical protein